MNYTADGGAPNAVVAAVQWLDGTLTGTLATLVAVIAVASLGLLFLSGRIDVRKAGRLLLGCFILFGASTIASGIINGLVGSSANEKELASVPPPATPPLPVQAATTENYDPYAGAALPPRR